MEIKKLAHGLEIHVDSKEIVDHFLKQALKQSKSKKPFQHSTAYARPFRIDVRFIETPSKKYRNQRKTMLEKAKGIKLRDFIAEFRLTGTKETQRLVSQFCNIFQNTDETLDWLVCMSRDEVLKFRGVGEKVEDLFEKFLKSKGFGLAIYWTGEEWI